MALPQSRISLNMGLISRQESVLSRAPEITQRTNVYIDYKMIQLNLTSIKQKVLEHMEIYLHVLKHSHGILNSFTYPYAA
jgi:hypothetical protein